MLKEVERRLQRGRGAVASPGSDLRVSGLSWRAAAPPWPAQNYSYNGRLRRSLHQPLLTPQAVNASEDRRQTGAFDPAGPSSPKLSSG